VKYERYKDSKKKTTKKNNEIRFKRLKITISPLIFLYVYVVQTKKIKIKKEEEEDNDAKSIFFLKKTQPSKPKISRIKIYL
jgi:hypothetical protein